MINIDVLGTDYPAPSNASDTNWASAQVALEQALAAGVNALDADVTALQASVTAAAALTWANITPINTWANSGGSTFRLASAKAFNGEVSVRGQIDTGAANTVCGVLPVGSRPAQVVYEVGVLVNTDDLCRVIISPNGNITIGGVTTANGGTVSAGVSLNFSFSVAANP